MPNKRFLTFLMMSMLSFSLLLVGCAGPQQSVPVAQEGVVPTAVVESDPTPADSETVPEPESVPETVVEEAEVTVEEVTTAVVIEELPPFTTLQFIPGQCVIELTEPATAYRAANLEMVQGMVEAGVYGVATYTLLSNEAGDRFFGVPMPDGRLVYVQYTPTVIPLNECPGISRPFPDIADAPSINDANETESLALMGTVWEWVGTSSAVEGEALVVETPEKFTVEFKGDGTLALLADCNVGGGTYEVDGSSIAIELGALSMAYCGEDSLDTTFLAQLDTAVIFFFQDGDLFFDRPMDSGTMRFTPAASDETANLVGPVWRWQSITTPLVAVTVPTPEQYTLQFNEDGTVSIRADCNQVGGTYTAVDGSLSLELGFSTAVACSPDSLDTTFLDSLSRTALYFFQGGDLYLDLVADSGTMHFIKE